MDTRLRDANGCSVALEHSVYAKALDPANLNAHICSLRMKLGAQARKRIQRVPGVGYVYVSPSKRAEADSAVASEWHRVQQRNI